MKGCDRSALTALWRDMGVREGMTLLCHSFIAVLGRPKTSPAHDVLGSLLDAVGPTGTFCAPTFSYTYFKGEVFDRAETPSDVGQLGDLTRTHPDGLRNLDPNFSNAAIGPGAPALLERTVKRSFGPETFYDRLVQADAWVLLIGVDFTALPLFMQIERMNEVPYRYEKTFHGRTRDGDRLFDDTAVHFVRDETLNFDSDRKPTGDLIDADPTCRHADFGYGHHRLVPASTVIRVAERRLREDPHALIRFEDDPSEQKASQ